MSLDFQLAHRCPHLVVEEPVVLDTDRRTFRPRAPVAGAGSVRVLVNDTYEVRVYDNGDIKWYLDGKLHRVDGPAIIRANGDQEWYLDGKRHRVDGPAITYANGDKEWYLNGKKLTEAEYQACIRKQPVADCQGRTVVIDGITYKLEAL